MDVDELARRVLAAPARAGSTRVVAVDGPSGSGKTTLAGALAGALARALLGAPAPVSGRADVAVLHLDDLYPGWDGLAAAVPLLVHGVLEPLADGRPGRYHWWDWAAGAPGDAVDVPPSAVLVVEGAGAGSRAAARYLSLLVWVDADEATRRERALARDGATYRPHWERWAAQERALFAAEVTASRADVVLRT